MYAYVGNNGNTGDSDGSSGGSSAGGIAGGVIGGIIVVIIIIIIIIVIYYFVSRKSKGKVVYIHMYINICMLYKL